MALDEPRSYVAAVLAVVGMVLAAAVWIILAMDRTPRR